MTLTMAIITAWHPALLRPLVSQHASGLERGLVSDCEDLYAIALKTNRRSVALAGSLGAGLEPANDLSSAIVNWRHDPI
jgi:hypothetical protein